MGMSIDEAIRYYEDKNVVLTEEEALANTIALNVMRKYQKIEHIIRYDWGKGYQLSETINRIKEVLENGNND